MNSLSKTLVSIALIFILSCSEEKHSTLTGEVFYIERIALTEEAVITIFLVDISKPDEKEHVVTEKSIKNPGQVPISFVIQFNPDEIFPSNTYSLKVKIEDRGSLLFTDDKGYPVINNGVTEDIKIKVVPVDGNVKREIEDVNGRKLNTPKEIDNHINQMQKVSGKWAMGDASSVFDAYYAGDELKLMVEQMDMGDYGSSDYRYYFKEGYLFYHEQNGKRMAPNSDNPDEAADINVIMHFNPEGTLVASSKKVNFNLVELHDIEAPGVLRHCELLIEISDDQFNIVKQ